MAEHDAFGLAAGAGGIDEAGGILGAQAGCGIRTEVGQLLARGQRVLPGQHRQVQLARGLERLDADDQAGGRRLGDRRQQRLRQAVVRDHDRGRAAVLEQVGVVARGVGRIGRDGDRARGHDREIGDQPFRSVLGDQQHAVAGRHALGAQHAGEQTRLACRPLPAPGPVDPVALEPEKGLLAAPPGRPLEQLDQVRTQIRRRHSISRRSPALERTVTLPAAGRPGAAQADSTEAHR